MNDFSIESLLSLHSIKLLFKIFKNEKNNIKLVGGSVRDALLGKEAKDLDFAANILPDKIIEILKKNQIQYEDFAYQYGSIIAYIGHKKIQITSLREDINQFGRHTNVVYTKSWKKDAARRDFTFNAIFVDQKFKVYDYYDGQKDLENKKIKFIREADQRIKEDYLRIYRYFRFLALFDIPNIDLREHSIVETYIHESLNVLTNDVIRQEILKMFNMPYPLNCFYQSMQNQIKFKWVEIIKEHFIRTNYELGLKKCLNKIDNIIN